MITKHPPTGGVVDRDTVTAQLLYEIGGPRYAGPVVVALRAMSFAGPAGSAMFRCAVECSRYRGIADCSLQPPDLILPLPPHFVQRGG